MSTMGINTLTPRTRKEPRAVRYWMQENEAGGDSELEARYSNCFVIEHNAHEFVFDFGQVYSETGEALLHTRLITNPFQAKALLSLLRESVEKHEERFGTIAIEKELE